MMAPAQFLNYVELLLKLLAPHVRNANAILDGILSRTGRAQGAAA